MLGVIGFQPGVCTVGITTLVAGTGDLGPRLGAAREPGAGVVEAGGDRRMMRDGWRSSGDGSRGDRSRWNFVGVISKRFRHYFSREASKSSQSLSRAVV